jgi:hypothetical protein
MPEAPAAEIVEYYATRATIGGSGSDDLIPVGPNGANVQRLRWDGDNRGLVYTFEIPGPAEAISGDASFQRGYGELLLYLNEEAVPVDWSDLGDHAGDVPDGSESGYDINNDKTIANKLTASAKSALERGDFKGFKADVEPLRLPVDITVRYFNDPAHSEPLYDSTRRSVYIGLTTEFTE